MSTSASYPILATGTFEHTCIIIPTNFKEDMWVQAYERQAESKWLREYLGRRAFRSRSP